MNILIINAFGNSLSSKTTFETFCVLIKQTLKRISKYSGIDHFDFIYKNPTNIDEFIYDPDFNPNEGTKTNINNKKNFDKIDMVFIDGYEKYLPWERIGYKLSLLLRLCKTCNKILYAGGVALEILIYYLATGSHNELNFINAKGEIQSIEEIHLIPMQFLNEIKKNDHFLDFVTGDVLEYRAITKTWESIVNIGLHKQIIAEKYMSRGKFVLPNHYTDKHYNDKAIVSNCKEIKLVINKQFLSHWLVKNVPNEFVCYSTLTWFPHYFNVCYEKFQFQTICECNKGPVVIEHGNSIGVAFHAGKQYKETVIMLENFIKHKFKYLHERLYHLSMINNNNNNENNECMNMFSVDSCGNDHKKEKEVPSMFKSYKLNDETKLNALKDKYKKKSLSPMSYIEKVNCSRPFSKVMKVKKEAAHCGFSFNNRNMVFVEDNSINQQPVSCYGIDVVNHSNKVNKRKHKYKEIQLHTTPINSDGDNNDDIKQIYKAKANSKEQRARIRSVFIDDDDDNDNEHITLSPMNSVKKRSNTFTQNEETKIHNKKDEMNKHEQIHEEYVTFIDKEKMEEEHMLNYYKHLRKEISMKLKEINIANDYKDKKKNVLLKLKKTHKGRNSYSNISLNKKPSNNSNMFLHSNHTTTTNNNNINNTLSNYNIFKKSSQYISMYPYIKKVSSLHEMKVPIAEPSFPFTEENNKEHEMRKKHKKTKLNYNNNNNGIIKIYDKYNKIGITVKDYLEYINSITKPNL